jgi:hypothetical protein
LRQVFDVIGPVGLPIKMYGTIGRTILHLHLPGGRVDCPRQKRESMPPGHTGQAA